MKYSPSLGWTAPAVPIFVCVSALHKWLSFYSREGRHYPRTYANHRTKLLPTPSPITQGARQPLTDLPSLLWCDLEAQCYSHSISITTQAFVLFQIFCCHYGEGRNRQCPCYQVAHMLVLTVIPAPASLALISSTCNHSLRAIF